MNSSINDGVNCYEFFRSNRERKEVLIYSRAIAKYLYNQDIVNFVLVDRNARPMYVGVLECWKVLYPKDEHPDVYFFNPWGFKYMAEDDIIKELQTIYCLMLREMGKPTLLFDTCIHSGHTLLPIKRILEKIGFTDLRVGAITPAEEGSKVHADFYVTAGTPQNECNPFYVESMVVKTDDSICSKINEDISDRLKASRLRREIKRIISEFDINIDTYKSSVPSH